MSISAEQALREIQELMSDNGRWSADTLEAIAQVMNKAGYPIEETCSIPEPGCQM